MRKRKDTSISNFEQFIMNCKNNGYVPFELDIVDYKGPAFKIPDDNFKKDSVTRNFTIPLIIKKLQHSDNVLVVYPNLKNHVLTKSEIVAQIEEEKEIKENENSPWILLHETSSESTYLMETTQGVIVRYSKQGSQSMVFIQFGKLEDFGITKESIPTIELKEENKNEQE